MENITKNNKLIANFMGFKMVVENYHGINILESPENKQYDLLGLKYHKEWNWLMPVVQKCYLIVDDIEISDSLYVVCDMLINDIQIEFYNPEINSVYNAVINFIQWYNLNVKV